MKKIAHRVVHHFNSHITENVFKVAIILALLGTLYIFFQNIFISLIGGLIATVFLIGWDGRIFFALGLIFLLFCPFLLPFEKRATAEQMAVYAYYMLALGVFLQLVHYIKERVEENRERKRQKAFLSHREYWTKGKLALWTATIVVLTAIISGGSFYVFYSRLKKDLSESKQQFLLLAEETAKKVQESSQKEQQDESPKKARVEVLKESGDWETVKVFVVNTTDKKGLELEIAEQFKNLGVFNTYPSQTTSTPVVTSTVEYCSDCYNVATELSARLLNSKSVQLTEQKEFDNQIKVMLGTDQLPVKE